MTQHEEVCNHIIAGAMIKRPMSFDLPFITWRGHNSDARQLKGYIDDPVSFVHQRAMDILKRMAGHDVTLMHIKIQLEPVRDHLHMMRACIPKLIKSQKALLQSIANDKRSRKELNANYLDLEKVVIPELQEQVAAFGLRHVRTFDCQASEVETKLPEMTTFGKPSRVASLFSEISQGVMTRHSDRGPVRVCVKVYIRKVSYLHLAREEENIRWVLQCLQHGVQRA